MTSAYRNARLATSGAVTLAALVFMSASAQAQTFTDGTCDPSAPPRQIEYLTATQQQPSGRIAWVNGEPLTYRVVSRSPNLNSPVPAEADPCVSNYHFEWDLDGDGTFETDTGNATQATTTYASPRWFEASVRVSNAHGTSSTSRTVEIRLAPPPGLPGVSINGGAQFTNDPDVEVSVVWPRMMTEVMLSNDGGFGPAATKTFPVAERVPWTLQSSGPERLPKTVYARACGETTIGAGYSCTSQSATDDIILDETAPTLSDVVVDAPGQQRASAVVNIRAKDAVSGVEYMQLTSKKNKPGKWLDFASQTRYRGNPTKLYVRVQDAAGNASIWQRAKLK